MVEGRVGEESDLGPQGPIRRTPRAGEGSGLTQKPLVPEPEPPGLAQESQGLGKLRAPTIRVPICYWKMLWVKTD